MVDLIRRPSSLLGTSLFDNFDRIFDEFLQPFTRVNTSLGLPSVDIYSEDDQHMVVALQVPGFDQNDIEINVRDGVLEIRGERSQQEEEKDKKRSYMVRESSAAFVRRVVLPDGADSDNISAELDKGILKVTIPVERSEVKRVEITGPAGKSAKKLTESTETK